MALSKRAQIMRTKRATKKLVRDQISIEKSLDKEVFAFPFEIVSGSVWLTSRGESTGRVTEGAETTLLKVITGEESVIALWENSVELNLREIDSDEDRDTRIEKTYQAGRAIKGLVRSNTSNVTIDSLQENNNFTKMEITDNVVLSMDYTDWVDKNYDGRPSDYFKLWVIPELNKEQWMVVSDTEVINDENGNPIQIKVLLTSLNERLAQSGLNVRSYVNQGAPGEGYAWPIVFDDEGVKTFGIDKTRLQDQPITSLQVQFDGNVGLCAIDVMGRPIDFEYNTTNSDLQVPRKLLFSEFKTPIISRLSETGTPPSNYRVIRDGSLASETFSGSWREKADADFDPSKVKQFEGVLVYDVEKTTATNPFVVPDFTNSPDNETPTSYRDLGTFSTPSERPEDLFVGATDTSRKYGTAYKYNMMNSDWEFAHNSSYDTQPCFEIEEDYFTTNNSLYRALDVLNLNGFVHSHIEQLPIGSREHIVNTWKDIPIIGGIAKGIGDTISGIAGIGSGYTSGFYPGWKDIKARVTTPPIDMLISSDVLASASTWLGEQQRDSIPMETFKAPDKNDSIGSIINKPHIFHMTLTDDYNDGGVIKNTVDIAHNGTNYWNNNCRAVNPDLSTDIKKGYTIDLVNIKALGQTKFKLTMFNGSDPIWEGYFQTKALFTNSMSNWSTSIVTSPWGAPQLQGDYDVRYPIIPIPPVPTDPELTADPQYQKFHTFTDIVNETIGKNQGEEIVGTEFDPGEVSITEGSEYIGIMMVDATFDGSFKNGQSIGQSYGKKAWYGNEGWNYDKGNNNDPSTTTVDDVNGNAIGGHYLPELQLHTMSNFTAWRLRLDNITKQRRDIDTTITIPYTDLDERLVDRTRANAQIKSVKVSMKNLRYTRNQNIGINSTLEDKIFDPIFVLNRNNNGFEHSETVTTTITNSGNGYENEGTILDMPNAQMFRTHIYSSGPEEGWGYGISSSKPNCGISFTESAIVINVDQFIVEQKIHHKFNGTASRLGSFDLINWKNLLTVSLDIELFEDREWTP